ncbi:MAG: hypothetical protein AABY90_08560, partial [Nitrospirota bacterium]
MLAAYLDASRTEKGQPFVIIAGYVATVSRWRTFQSKWQELLATENLPFFHMTDFEAYQGHYKTWTKKRHNHVIKKITRAIRGRIDFSFARGVSLEDFEWALTKNQQLQLYKPF